MKNEIHVTNFKNEMTYLLKLGKLNMQTSWKFNTVCNCKLNLEHHWKLNTQCN
jgi:hypothetical protein